MKNGKTQSGKMQKIKLVALVVIAVLAVIIFFQNRETVETRFLFATIKMSRALLLILTFVLGFVTGLLVTTHVLRRKKDAKM
jgi:uncharacterized integral membrane protein